MLQWSFYKKKPIFTVIVFNCMRTFLFCSSVHRMVFTDVYTVYLPLQSFRLCNNPSTLIVEEEDRGEGRERFVCVTTWLTDSLVCFYSLLIVYKTLFRVQRNLLIVHSLILLELLVFLFFFPSSTSSVCVARCSVQKSGRGRMQD